MSISEGKATQQSRFPVMDGFICRAMIQNGHFFLLPQHIAGRDATQPEASLAATKRVTEAQQKHTMRFSLMLSAADRTLSPLPSKVKSKSLDLLSFTPAQRC